MKTLTITDNIVTIDGISKEIDISLDENITAVQYHEATGRCLEEPLMKEVDLSRYQTFIDKFNEPIPVVEKVMTYADYRLQEYPTIGEQLDMLYHDQMNNTSNWLNTITTIKAKYPKNLI